MAPKKKNDDCFRVVTKEEIYQQIVSLGAKIDTFNQQNQLAHEKIVERIDSEVSFAKVEVQKAKTEHEAIRGRINVVSAGLVTLTTLVLLVVGWVITNAPLLGK
jgi:sulfur transfer protein SufE